MHTQQLLVALRSHDVKLTVASGQLELDIPEAEDITYLIPAIRQNKAELVAYINANSNAGLKIPKAPAQPHYPATVGQTAAYLASAYRNPDASVGFTFNMSKAVVLDHLNLDLVEESFHALVHRFDILRTTYQFIEGQVRQVIAPADGFALPIRHVDLSDAADVDAAMEALMAQPVVFDFEQGPLFDVQLARINAYQHLLVFTIHHGVCDKTSMDIVERDLMSIYFNKVQNSGEALPPPALQFKDYVTWCQQVISRDDLLSHKAYWQDELADLPTETIATALGQSPVEHNAVGYREKLSQELDQSNDYEKLTEAQKESLYGVIAIAEFRHGHAYHAYFNEAEVAAIRSLATACKVSDSVAVIALINMVLCQLTGCNDQTLALNTTLRDSEQLTEMVGFLTNTIYLRNKIQPNATLAEVVTQVNNKINEVYEYRMYPIEHLVNDLNLPLHHISKVFVNMINMAEVPFDAGQFKAGHQPQTTYPYFDVDFNINMYQNTLTVVCNYVRSNYSKNAIEHLFNTFKATLKQVDKGVDTPFAQLMPLQTA